MGLYVQFVWSVCSIKKTKKEKNCMGPFTNFPREAKAYNCYIASKNTSKTKYSIIYSGKTYSTLKNKNKIFYFQKGPINSGKYGTF